MKTRDVARAVILVAVAVALSPFFIPVGISKCFPAQHMINVIAAVMLGPTYAICIAFIAAVLRNLLGLGTLLAFPGGMIGALLAGLAYRAFKNMYLAGLGEVVGTGLFGAMASAWLIGPVLMGKPMAVGALIVAFSVSSLGGTALGLIVLNILRRGDLAAYVELNRVSYRYPGAARILKEIDLTIPVGESTAVFGASGSGKSTLAYLFNGLIPHFFGGLLEGTVVVAGNSTRNKMVSELFSHVGLVLQNTDAQLFNATVEDDVAFGLESLGYPATDIRKRTRRILEALGIPHLLHRSPDTLSGGEKRLAAIATVLCLDPALLVLDEPFAGLDHKGTRIVRDLLRQIQRHGKNLILIEHRTKPFFTEADRCIVIDEGAVSFDGKPAEASGVLLETHLTPRYPERMVRTRSRSDESVLVVKDLSYRIEGRDILCDISLSLARGEAVAIVGENGAGKTTLIKHFNGLYKPTTGEVSFKGRCIRNLHPSARAVAVGVCFQNPNDQFFEADVRKEILAGPKRLGQVDWKWFEQICDTLSLHLLLDRSPYRLSEGEKRRVALASILVMRPEVLVLDEPTAGQDGRFKETLAQMCASISEMGTAVVVVTHDLDFARTTADRWVVMHAGRIAADGAPEKMCEKLLSILEDATDRPLRSVADCR